MLRCVWQSIPSKIVCCDLQNWFNTFIDWPRDIWNDNTQIIWQNHVKLVPGPICMNKCVYTKSLREYNTSISIFLICMYVLCINVLYAHVKQLICLWHFRNVLKNEYLMIHPYLIPQPTHCNNNTFYVTKITIFHKCN